MTRITIIGGGPGGYTAAFAAAKAGAAVTLVEASAMGGTCLNWGCIPTKTMKVSAHAFEQASHLNDYGIEGAGQPTLNMKAVVARKDRVGQVLRTGLEKTCAALKIKLIKAYASIQDRNLVQVKHADGAVEYIESDFIIIATGSKTLDLPSLPVDHTHILCSDDALALENIPKRLVIVGGGVIGSEFAFIYQAFGSKVTLVEGQNRLLPLPSVDDDISKLLLREAKKKGISTELSQTVKQATVLADGTVKVIIGASKSAESTTPDSEHIVDAVLVAVGRVPCTQGLGLEAVGVELDSRGWVKVNEHLQTAVPNIYAIGDTLGPAHIMLAHVASTEGLCAVENCLAMAKNAGATLKKMDYSVVPSGIFTSPEIGTVGLAEEEAKSKGHAVLTSLFQMRELGKAQAMGELAGVIKIIAEEKTGTILGVQMAGAHATDLIAEATLAIKMGATVQDVAGTIHAHPTLAEGFYDACVALSEKIK